MSEVDELDLLIEHRERTQRFLDVKAAAQAKPDDEKAQAAWRKEKDDHREWRQEWRDVRSAFAAEPADGDATASPAALATKTKPKGV